MDRRIFLLTTLAGAASPGRGPKIETNPPQLVMSALEPGAESADPAFDAWASDFLDRSARDGWPSDVLQREFAGMTSDPRVLALDGRQPEFSKPIGDYVKGVVTPTRVAMAQSRESALPWLPRVEARFGVPAEILVSIWAVESGFGAMQGDFDVLRSLATLAAAGRRREWAESQIHAVIRIIATHQAVRGQLRGSWAGAMGQTQFEPETYLTTAVHFEGDGPADIWGSAEDALASAANLLAKAGWVPGQHWQREVILPPTFDYGLSEGPKQTPAAWAALGARPADGMGWFGADAEAQAMLILPSGATGPAFLALPNHFVIRSYNNSTAYALAVGLLADQIHGAPPLARPWPYEVALSTADRTGAQAALAQLGFDPGQPDGLIGAKTRIALRAWQKARGLPADGYLSPDMLHRLQTEVGQANAAGPTPIR
jgi:membrane-bound lytic murein transglycosylase B